METASGVKMNSAHVESHMIVLIKAESTRPGEGLIKWLIPDGLTIRLIFSHNEHVRWIQESTHEKLSAETSHKQQRLKCLFTLNLKESCFMANSAPDLLIHNSKLDVSNNTFYFDLIQTFKQG